MAKSQLPSIDLIRQCFRYEPGTGKLFWCERPEAHFASPAIAADWNSRYSGMEAGSFRGKRYPTIGLGGKSLLAHRVAWAVYYGEWPEGQIDHINHCRNDNRIDNLRLVSGAQNQRNRALNENNTSGVCGVWWFEKRGKWRAQIKRSGSVKVLGMFDRFDDAVAARKAAEAASGFHPNHGS